MGVNGATLSSRGGWLTSRARFELKTGTPVRESPGHAIDWVAGIIEMMVLWDWDLHSPIGEMEWTGQTVRGQTKHNPRVCG